MIHAIELFSASMQAGKHHVLAQHSSHSTVVLACHCICALTASCIHLHNIAQVMPPPQFVRNTWFQAVLSRNAPTGCTVCASTTVPRMFKTGRCRFPEHYVAHITHLTCSRKDHMNICFCRSHTHAGSLYPSPSDCPLSPHVLLRSAACVHHAKTRSVSACWTIAANLWHVM